MKRFKWLSIVLVVTVSIAFVSAGQQVKEKTDKKEQKKESSCIEALAGLKALKALEALEALKDFDMDINMQGMALAMDSLKMLEGLDLHFDFDDLNFDWDDFNFDFNFDWLKDLDWEWEDEVDRTRSISASGLTTYRPWEVLVFVSLIKR